MDTVVIVMETYEQTALILKLAAQLIAKPVWESSGRLSLCRSGKKVSPFQNGERRRGGKIQGKFVFLRWVEGRPRDSEMVPWAQMTCHLDDFATWNDFIGWLRKVLGEDVPVILGCRISRMDCCIDVGLLYEDLISSIHRKRVRRVTHWSSGSGKTLYLGGKPKQVYLYERNLVRAPDFPFEMGLDLKKVTRIEVRMSGKALPVKVLGDIPKIAQLNPFDVLVVQYLDEAYARVSSARFADTYRIYAFLKRAAEVGFSQAKREFNVNKNFNRDIASYLRPLDPNILNIAWEARKKRFFLYDDGRECSNA